MSEITPFTTEPIALVPELHLQQPGHTNWTSTVVGKFVAASTLLVEISPLNEVARLAAFGIAYKYGGVETAAVVAGASTLALESGAAIVTADVLDTQTGRTSIAKINQKLTKIRADKALKTGVLAETALALTGGSSVVTLAKHRQDTSRSRSENRRYGLKSAAGISAVTTAQAFLLGEGISAVSTSTLALGAAALGAVIYGVNRIRNNNEDQDPSSVHNEISAYDSNFASLEISQQVALTPEQVELYVATYDKLISDSNSPQHLGLSWAEASKALHNPDAINLTCETAEGEKITLPFLVPLTELYWYNTDHLKKHYGTEKLYYYTHLPLSFEDGSPEAMAIKSIIEGGGVIIYDMSTAPGAVPKGNLGEQLQEMPWAESERLGGKQERFLNQYAQKITLQHDINPDVEAYQVAKSISEQYKEEVDAGRIKFDEHNGPAIVDSITGTQADDLWQIYKQAFDKIGDGHPVNAGFDHDEFMHILASPSVAKVIDRKDGLITALATFLTNFDDCPWLNPEYYTSHHSEAVDTNNVFIFTGIVADEKRSGSLRSMGLIALLIKVVAARKSPVLLTFECGDESAKYVPKILEAAINLRTAGRVSDLRNHISQLSFHAIKKASN